MSAIHPSRKQFFPKETRKAPGSRKRKRKRKHPTIPSNVVEANIDDDGYSNSLPSSDRPKPGMLRNTIRNLERLLAYDDKLVSAAAQRQEAGKEAGTEEAPKKKVKRMPANVRIEKERELAHWKAELEDAKAKKRRSEMIGKYHKIRFFERQKATRKLRKLENALKEAEDGSEAIIELEERRRISEVDLNYAIYHPLETRYESLFAKERKDEPKQDNSPESNAPKLLYGGQADTDEIRKHKPAMWHIVEQAMQDGKLKELREGRHPRKETTEPGGKSPSRTNIFGVESQDAKGNLRTHAGETDESDGGFFDE